MNRQFNEWNWIPALPKGRSTRFGIFPFYSQLKYGPILKVHVKEMDSGCNRICRPLVLSKK